MADPTRRKTQFVKDDAQETQIDRIVGLHLDFSNRWGAKGRVDLTKLNERPELAQAMAQAIADFCQPDGPIKRSATIRGYIEPVHSYFWVFLKSEEANGHAPFLESQDIKTETLNDFGNWLEQNVKQTTAGIMYDAVARIFIHLKESYPQLVDAELDPPRGKFRQRHRVVIHRPSYSARESSKIIKAARAKVLSIVTRLDRERKDFLEKGTDPRLTKEGWKPIENALWYIQNVLDGRYVTWKELRNGDSDYVPLLNVLRSCQFYTKKQIYSYLFPSPDDLMPFMILLGMKTGLNVQSLLDLRRDCLKPALAEGKIQITYSKFKTGPTHKIHQKIFSDRSMFDPGAIVRMVLKLTESCLPFVPESDREYLWLYLLHDNGGTGFRRADEDLCHRKARQFAELQELTDDDGKPLTLNLSRLRPTQLTSRYKAAGNLAAVSRDAKHVDPNTSVGYVDNKETHQIHEQTAADVIQEFHDEVRGKVFLQSPDEPEQVEQVATILEVSKEKASAILQGKQDVFVAACKDFYNRPGGKPNTACDRPWACFGCRNACWTTRTLPRLVRFYDFIVEQRSLLNAEDWKNKFGFPYGVITWHIFPAFPPDSIEVARFSAAKEPFFVPLHFRTI
jgi:hypothetical protein